jgi:hypothetical protein
VRLTLNLEELKRGYKMNNKKQLYSAWLAHRKRIAAPKTFSKNVMEEINRAHVTQVKPHNADLPYNLDQPLSRWMAAAGLVLLGLFRILYIAGSLFRTNLVMPY